MTPEFIVGDRKKIQGLGEYGQVICQVSSHHLSCNGIHLGLSHYFHCFPCLFLVYQEGECVQYYFYMMNMVIWVFKSDLVAFGQWRRFFPEEGLCFWMYLYFYLTPSDLINVCDCSESVVLWVPLLVC